MTVAIDGDGRRRALPGDARDAGELARRADVAMSDAKRRRVGVARYTSERDDHSRDRLELAADLRRALASRDNGGLWAAFQPQIDLETGQVVGRRDADPLDASGARRDLRRPSCCPWPSAAARWPG